MWDSRLSSGKKKSRERLVLTGGVNMAAIKHNLQRDLFKPSEERLYAVVSVTKAGKKKKASFLCVAGMNSVRIRADNS